jgi:hypothetical protein
MPVAVPAVSLQLAVRPHKLPAVVEVKVSMVLDSMDLPIQVEVVVVDQG